MNFKKLFFAAVIVLSANAAIAQKTATHDVTISIPEIALLDLEGPAGVSNITLTPTVPTDAGLPMTFEAATNSTIWMNYTSIIKGAPLRKVTVKIQTGDVPAGLKLTVEAGVYSGAGKGTMGTKTGIITLDKITDAIIVGGIGSAYTGNKENNGHLLTYKLDYANVASPDFGALIVVDPTPLTILYTLTDI